jgi:homoserine O-succinyltransferase
VQILAESDRAGVYLASANDNRQIFVIGHPEYDRLTLREEYDRDLAKGLTTPLPVNYFPKNDRGQMPAANWQSHATLLFMNWLNIVYQKTPFNLDDLEQM